MATQSAKRIHELTEQASPESGDLVVVDKAANSAAKKMTLVNAVQGALGDDYTALAAYQAALAAAEADQVLTATGPGEAVFAAPAAGGAANITFEPAGNIAATDVQAAIEELDNETTASIATLPFSPANIPGMVFWLRADGILQADNTAVTAWKDTSGWRRDCTPPAATNQPTYQINELNGLGVVRFDGTDDYFDGPTFYLPQPGTIIILAKWTYSGGSLIETPGTANRWIVAGAGGNWFINGGTLLYGAAISQNNWQKLICEFNGANSAIEVDGNITTGNAGTQYMSGIRVGANISGTTGAGWVFKGDLAEIIIYNRLLTSGEKQMIRDYLS